MNKKKKAKKIIDKRKILWRKEKKTIFNSISCIAILLATKLFLDSGAFVYIWMKAERSRPRTAFDKERKIIYSHLRRNHLIKRLLIYLVIFLLHGRLHKTDWSLIAEHKRDVSISDSLKCFSFSEHVRVVRADHE